MLFRSGGRAKPRGELKAIFAANEGQQRAMHAMLNSSTYYQFFCVYTDGRHINPSDVVGFPLDLARLHDAVQKRLVILSKKLESAAKQHLGGLFCFTAPAALPIFSFFFFFNDPTTTEIYTLSLHDPLPI